MYLGYDGMAHCQNIQELMQIGIERVSIIIEGVVDGVVIKVDLLGGGCPSGRRCGCGGALALLAWRFFHLGKFFFDDLPIRSQFIRGRPRGRGGPTRAP